MDLDISRCAFSRYGSYLSLFQPTAESGPGTGLCLRTHHAARLGQRELCHLDLLRRGGRPVRSTVEATEAVVTLRPAGARGAGQVRLCLADPQRDVLAIDGHGGTGLRLRAVVKAPTIAQPVGPDRWSINLRPAYCRLMVEGVRGTLRADASWDPHGNTPITLDLLPDREGRLEARIQMYRSTWVPGPAVDVDRAVDEARADFARWVSRQPPAPPRLRAAHRLAAYVNWAAVIRPGGLIRRHAMLMSKMWMDNVWSWDHCFNAMALCHRDPAAALDQWMLPFDRQDAFGALPDAHNPAIEHFCFCKPPVHGWSLDYMLRHAPRHFTAARLRDLYAPLQAWTRWWVDHRTSDLDGLPYYLHGNDSGWDNSTMFDAGAPLIAPDLAAFLSIQCEVLAQVAGRIDRPREARTWQRRAESLRAALIRRLWRGERFIAVRMADRAEIECRSLVPCMPILLGSRLPADVRSALVARLRRHLTPWGLATEETDSPEYTPDGYWRGPIWAPSTLIAVDGLLGCGETRLATDVARRFCRLCARSGFAENFDALTGAPLRDPAYTWTSSVFLVLARMLTVPRQ